MLENQQIVQTEMHKCINQMVANKEICKLTPCKPYRNLNKSINRWSLGVVKGLRTIVDKHSKPFLRKSSSDT